MRGVWVGDLHLDRLKKLYPNALELQAAEICKPLEYALSQGIKFVVFAGDIGEHPTLSEGALLVLLNTVVEYGKHLDIHIILGNHDFAETGVHSLKVLEFLQQNKLLKCSIYIKATQVEIEGVAVNFLPYPYKKPLVCPSPTVNIGHFEVKGSLRDNGSVSGSEYRIKDKNLWLIGHLHTPHTIRNNVFYGGTLYQLNFGESLPKYWLDFSVKNKKGKFTFNVEYIENSPAFKLFNLEINTAHDLEKIKDKEHYRYKLFLKEGVILPEDVNIKYPQIYNISGYRTRKELEALQQNIILPMEDQTLEKVDVFFGLDDYLRSKGANKQQAKRALHLAKLAQDKLFSN